MRTVVCPLLLTFLLAACTAVPPSTPPPTAPAPTPTPLEAPTPPTDEEDLTFGEALAPTPPPSPEPQPPRPAEPNGAEGEVGRSGEPPPPSDLSTEASAKVEAPPEGAKEGAAQKRVIPISVQNWSFTPALIRAKKGEVIELQLTGVSGTHGFSVPDLGINVPVAPGETKTVSLPTDTPGTFAGLCSIPCGAGHRDMKFSVTVEP